MTRIQLVGRLSDDVGCPVAAGSFFVALRLRTDDRWAYRFVIDGDRVINDWYADDYIVGPDGACLSLLHT